MSDSRRIAVVTGANRGIGLAITRALAGQGFTVVMCAREASAGAEAHKALAGEGLDVILRKLDVSQGEQVASLARWLGEQFGHIEVLVNNAGIMLESRQAGAKHSADPMQVSMTSVLEHLNVNTLGAVRMIQALAPLMPEGGRIVNISSGLGQLEDMGSGHLGYRLSKTALNAATRVFSSELAARGVRVYTMCPGWVRTRMGGDRASRSPEEGADTAIWLATTTPAPNSGLFFRNRKPLAW